MLDPFHIAGTIADAVRDLLPYTTIVIGMSIPSVRELWQNNAVVQRVRGARTQAERARSQAASARAAAGNAQTHGSKVAAAGAKASDTAKGATGTTAPPAKKKWYQRRRRAPKDTSLRDLSLSFRHEVNRLKVEREVSTMRAAIGDNNHIYDTPWFLLLGEESAGKSSLLANSSLEHWSNTDLPGEKFCGWWRSEKGIILDVTGEYVLRTEGAPNSKGWRRLLSLLRRHRDQRPIDGVILAIPAHDLVGTTALTHEEHTRKGEALSQRLRDIEKGLGMSVPVYTVITRCDNLPGFSAFCGHLPRIRHNEIFGWSNPYALETGYTPKWIDEAFESMSDAIYPSQLEMFADLRGSADGDELFVLPGEFQRLRDGIRCYTEEIFRDSSYHNITLLMRGLYFTGDSTEPVSQQGLGILSNLETLTIPPMDVGFAPVPPPHPSPALTNGNTATTDVPQIAFVRDLLDNRVLPEYAIGYPIRGKRLARNRIVRTLQITIGIIALLSVLAYIIEYPRMRYSANILDSTLDTIQVDLDRLDHGQVVTGDDYVACAEHILDGLSRIDKNNLSSPLFPSSWFSPLHRDIQRTMGVAFQRVILTAMRFQLEKRAKSIPQAMLDRAMVDTIGHVTIAIEHTPEFMQLQKYVKEMQALERHILLFNGLKRTESLEDVRQLVRYLFNRDLLDEFMENSDYYQHAIDYVTIEPISPSAFRDRSVNTARQLMMNLEQRMFTYNVILAGVRGVIGDVAYLALNSSAGGIESVNRMRSLRENIVGLKAALADPRTAWVSRETFRPDSALNELLFAMDSTAFLRGYGLRQEFIDTAQFRFRFLYRDILQEPSDIIGPIVVASGIGRALNLERSVDSLRSAIVELLEQRFMRALSRERITTRRHSGTLVLWNSDQLSEAMKMQDPYMAFVDKSLGNFPDRLRDPARNVARNGLEATMMEMINPAQRSQPSSGSPDDLRREIQSVAGATPQFEKILSLFDQLQLPAYSELRATLQTQGNLMLADLTGLMRKYVAYTIADERFGRYVELQRNEIEQPLGAVLLDAGEAAAIADYLAGPREILSGYASELATPILTFLAAVGGTGGDDGAMWRKIATELRKYENKVPGNSVAVMEELFLDLNNITQDNYADRLIRKGNTDYFLSVREALRSRLEALFIDLVRVKAVAKYRSLRARFNSGLLGEYPFADPRLNPSSIRSLGLDELRAYLQEFEEFRVRYRSIIAGWDRANASRQEKDVYRFINTMSAVGYFLAPLMSVDPDKPPVLTLDVEFRTNETKSRGMDQIIDWDLEIGRQKMSLQENLRQGLPLRATWEVGNRVQLTLRWAKNARSIPLSTTYPHAIVLDDRRTVVFNFNDPWSLVRFMRLHRADPRNLGRNTAPQTLEFTVTTVPNITTSDEVPLYRDPDPNAALIFVRLGVLGQKRRESLELPDFPFKEAPDLP